ncbi:alpha/beta hydrolase [Diaminobutyricimonas sp. TR449]|uniref:alpha/beta fold hydrolase n=2 Tax=unclassified Diaminobutyricimonas TaxID=2643261 RepID=UPI00141E3EC2|nr:alpha/beta hydrolase [Diaminobutyricimonas sp. TR449]
MVKTLFDGIAKRTVATPRLRANVLEKPAAGDAETVVFIHGNVSSSLFFQPTMLALPEDVRGIAIDLRGFGDSETLPVDATRGLRDYSDDVASVLTELGIHRAHFVGWSMGAGVMFQYLLDHGQSVETLTIIAPVSPYGFGGSTGADGRVLTADGAGTGGGAVNPDFIARLEAGDTSEDGATSPRVVYRAMYVKHPENLPHEDIWVESMLSTKTGPGNYPGTSVPSDNWPGFAAGDTGILNTMSPVHYNVTEIVNVAKKPPILWVRGVDDAIVGDHSFYDMNVLGEVGAVPGWPGEDVAPAQPMIQQTRAVLEQYQANGGTYRELALEDCGHSPFLEYPDLFNQALREHIGVAQ